jgi:hypothetical protein
VAVKISNNKPSRFYSILFKYNFYFIFIHFLFSKVPHKPIKIRARKCEGKYKNIKSEVEK